MVKCILSLVLLLVMSAAAVACPCVGNDEPCQCDPSCQCQGTEERVLDLPQDEHRHYLSVIGNPTDAKFIEVQNWFNSHEHLKAIKNQTHFNAISTKSTMYVQRYAKTVPAIPCIRLQDANGVTIYQASGASIPRNPDDLSSAITTDCFRRRQPTPAPNPRNDPPPQPLSPAVQPAVQPDVIEPTVTEGSDLPSPLVLMGCILLGSMLGGVAGIVHGYKIAHPVIG